MTNQNASVGRMDAIPVAFGPQSTTQKLYSEEIDPAKARSFWGEIGKAAIGVGKAIAERPKRARARAVFDGYANSNYTIDFDKLELYRDAFTGRYAVNKVSQNYLQDITGINDSFVYGANDNGKLFVDKDLEDVSETQYNATIAHEVGHTAYPTFDEASVEEVGKVYATHLRYDNDPSVSSAASKAVKGFEETERGITLGKNYRMAA